MSDSDKENKARDREIAENEAERQIVGDVRVSVWAIAVAVVIGLAAVHEVVVFQQVRPHPEEAAKWPSRRMGCNTDL